MDWTMEKKLTGKHVLMMLIAFFGVMFAVNMVFVYMALDSFSGLSVDDAYKKGLSYNEEIKRQEAQASRGWQTGLSVSTLEGRKIVVALKVANEDGKMPADLMAFADISRPARQDLDRTMTMVPIQGGFELETVLIEPGQWDLNIRLQGGGYETPYLLEKRIWVK